MSATIFFEGGGHTEATQAIHRRGLRAYCDKLITTRRLKVVAGGGRSQTYDKFERATEGCGPSDVVAILVDSEGPVNANTTADHLHAEDGWDLGLLRKHRAFLMVQTMEAWFLADREVLAAYYDGGFALNALPKSSTTVETVRKAEIEPALNRAIRETKKREYRKIEHGSDLMAAINPARVEAASRHAAEFNDFLRSLERS